MEVLALDLRSDFAHFRKFYTTTSPLTFLVPPRTAVIGLLGAILGLPKECYFESFPLHECKIGIQILKPLRKTAFKENWRAGPARLSKRTLTIAEMQDISRTPLELIKDPQYRIFFSHFKKKLWENILKMLQGKKSVYTPYLGLSEFLAEVQFVGVYEAEDLKTQPSQLIDIATVSPKEALIQLDSMDREYIETTLPNEVDFERKFKYLKVLFERNGLTIKAQIKSKAYGYAIKELGINILFLE